MWFRIFLLVCLLSKSVTSSAQSDSTFLFPESLGVNDIQSGIANIGAQKVISASRSLQAVEDLPFTLYVITKEDIRNNGYNTLVEALKMVPGIRTSETGSGVDGETFLMRGLRGNSYTKILINNIPIKPLGVKGMPLGAQLPIRQADRIEVIFGPAATLYGADASAGVINIILKETERPLYTKADISFGAEAYNAMNILFGGKAGKGKRVLKYNVFGNYTAFNDRRIYLDYGPLYDPTTYDAQGAYLNHPNYVRRDTFSDVPARSATPHLSRMFGIELSFGAFKLTTINMYRRDHSSLGLNPTAFSYHNPLNYIGETNNQFHLSYSRKKKNRAFNMTLNALNITSDNNSSYRIINSEFNKALILAAAADQITPGTTFEKASLYFDNFTSGNRYIYDQKIDVSLETTWNIQLSDKLAWMTGFTPRILVSTSEYFLRTPFPDAFDDHTVTAGGHKDSFDANSFTQFFYNTTKFNGLFGLQYAYSTTSTAEKPRLYPRLAALYKLSPKLSVRGFFGTAFRSPATYFSKNSYTINVGNYNWILLGSNTLKPEITTSFEGGIRWTGSERLYADIGFFTTSTENFIRPGLEFETQSSGTDLASITLGYFNEGNSYSVSSGIQSVLTVRDIIPAIALHANLHLTLADGRSVLSDSENEDRTREQPRVIGQLKLSFSPIKNIFIHTDHLYVSKSRNQSKLSDNLDDYRFLPAYYTMDLSVIGRLTDHFQINFRSKNLTNTSYAGLSATGTPDDLLWNQQSLRTWQLGFSYRME